MNIVSWLQRTAVLRITGLFTLRLLRRLGFRSARSLRSHASLQHIFAACNAPHCFIGRQKRRIQPERYAKPPNFFENIKKCLTEK
jgi:hypothetical protein